MGIGTNASGALPLEREVIREFDRMYRENAVYVLGVLRRFGLTRQQSEDLAQDVFEQMYLKLLSLDAEERHSLPIARAYLFRIAWNLFSNYRRRSSVRNERPSAVPPEVAVGPGAHNYVLAREMARLLDSIGPREVAVFVGFEVFGMTAAELAFDMCLTERDVRRILEEVRARLRQVAATKQGEALR